ncbi:419_t:CDS:2 [Acaulospora morrowiae]|uniref:419_t:CDS:1 n=1 Tax=Acaulospora morrowiae TaxID=94023 RepID=A0A9N9BNS7_9GLOM|nr:419_t:CDS:2 [Acaulospora morrowiae]
MSSTCTGSTSNPVFSLTNQLFQDVGVASSSWSMQTTKQKDTTNSFRSTSDFERAWQKETVEFDEWNKFIQSSEVGNDRYATEFMHSEHAIDDDEEFRQEWKKSLTQEFLESAIHHSAQFSHGYSEFTATSISTQITKHNDLLQAQFYFFDHLLSNVLSYPVSITCRPSSKSEWNWTRLFSPSRWSEKEDKDDEIPEDRYLKNVALGRLHLLFGHLSVNSGNKAKAEWEREFHGS